HFARDCRSSGNNNNNRRQGSWKPVPTHSTNSVSKGKGKEIDNIEVHVDHDFSNALAALVDDEPPRTVCMVDYKNEPTDDYMSIEQYDQYEQYERTLHDNESESDHEEYIRNDDPDEENHLPPHYSYTSLGAPPRSHSVPPGPRTPLAVISEEREEWPLATIERVEPTVHTDLSDAMRSGSDTDTTDHMD
ncbi:hypothetical protein N0V85_009915, partial [Neurospora sp. IMI 360204]